MEGSGYDQELQQLRDTEFRHTQGITYLDHAGATLYSSKQLEAHVHDLTTNLYGNPHSQNPSSNLTSECVDDIRELILRHFSTNPDCYDVVFTAGCTGALKLLSESFPWVGRTSRSDTVENGATKLGTDVVYIAEESAGRDISALQGSSVFCYLEDNHTSVVGMREVVAHTGGSVVCVNPMFIRRRLQNHQASTTSTVPLKSPVVSPTLSTTGPHHLFAYPAQSNFSGCKYPLEWVNDFSSGDHPVISLRHLRGSWKILLDAASFVSTSQLDLSSHPAHFVALSFYKMFGFPTGLGALLVHRDCWDLLHKRYYGGGTVLATLSREGFHAPRPQLHDRLEDGTLPFLDIVALKHGFTALTRIGRTMQHISLHSFSLARCVYYAMKDMQHANGSPVCVLYHHGSDFDSPHTQGPIVNFNLVRPDGSYVGYSEVETKASAKTIHLRTGCFCNTGACMLHLALSSEDVLEHFEGGHVCGDTVDLVDGRPTGSVRISFGYMSTSEDAKTFVRFIQKCFVDLRSSVTGHNGVNGERREEGFDVLLDGGCSNSHEEVAGEIEREVMVTQDMVSGLGSSESLNPECVSQAGCTSSLEGTPHQLAVGDVMYTKVTDGSSGGEWRVDQLALYPVKSCAAVKVVSSWPVGERGLLYDREWMVVGDRSTVLNQKKEGRLCLIQPHIDAKADTLTLTAPASDPLVLPLRSARPELQADSTDSLRARVFGEKVDGLDCGPAAASWLTGFLGRSCRLVRQTSDSQRRARVKGGKTASSEVGGLLSLANQAQYLLVTQESVDRLHQHMSINSVLSAGELLWRFRPNLVVSCSSSSVLQCDLGPYAEERWTHVSCNGKTFQVVEGCPRCRMIDTEQSSGEKSAVLFDTLSSIRGSNPRFGVYLSAAPAVTTVQR